jgi:hypothetical protein
MDFSLDSLVTSQYLNKSFHCIHAERECVCVYGKIFSIQHNKLHAQRITTNVAPSVVTCSELDCGDK